MKTSNIPNETTRLYNYDELHFIPVDQKNERWAAEVLYFCKGDSALLADPAVLNYRRKIDRGWLDETAMKAIIDPDEKKAEFFTSDWKANPIFIHLNNIVDAKIEKIPNNLLVKAADEFSQSNLMKENARIIGKKEFTSYLNDLNRQMGFPALKKTEDPFKYVQNMNAAPAGAKPGAGGKGKEASPMDMMDSLKAAVEDDEDLALFNGYIWKDGVEIASEIGIKHYLFQVNKFKNYDEDQLSDIRLANIGIFQFYTSETTGRPVFDYLDPSRTHTSPFSKNDLSDIYHWYKEVDVTFGDFARQMGAKLTPEELKKIFEKNKHVHNIDGYDKCSRYKRSQAKIRLGYCEFLSQDMEVYTAYETRGNMGFSKTTDDYQPSSYGKRKHNARREERHFNVWYKFYYIPFQMDSSVSLTDFEAQSKYIFKFGKVQDQQRFGEDNELVKPSLFGNMSKKMTWWEIMNAYMPQLHLLWTQAKNDFANAGPHGLVWVEEFLTAAMAVVDEGNDDEAGLKKAIVSRIRQTGSAVVKMLDAQGNPIANGKPYFDVKSGHLATGMERITAMMVIYQMMTRALGISEVAEGMDPKSRQSLGGIQLAQQGTNNSTYFIEKIYQANVVEAGERLITYFKDIVEEDGERLQELMDIVGKANGMALQTVRNIPLHRLGLSVHNIMTDEQKKMVNDMASGMAGAGMLDPDIALFITTIDNLKYAYAILRMKMKDKQRQVQEEKAQQNQFLLEMKKEDRMFEQAKLDQLLKGEHGIKDAMRVWDEKLLRLENELKQAGQNQIKDKIKENRIEESLVNHQLEKNKGVAVPAA